AGRTRARRRGAAGPRSRGAGRPRGGIRDRWRGPAGGRGRSGGGGWGDLSRGGQRAPGPAAPLEGAAAALAQGRAARAPGRLAQAIEAPLAGIKRGEAETGTKVGVIVCGIRTRSPAESLELARAAAEYRTAGVVAFDLAGAERGFAARDHAEAFAYAARQGLACPWH